ncbi:MAG: anaerobic ribonucleoside-triphosphate reductase activating protein [Acidobacteria bacterium]|nr:anaerobic ribonucleoside-triphosphate reductase activating protein [Acidobacteriota bacterium]MBI3487139.1 anaerobic ribonucleoside-triphosphate reductase activating protein [Acidobacteriota bacterium]
MPEGEALRIGGMVPFTTLDFPGHLAAVLFCQGCPWRCGYCHNPHIQGLHPPEGAWRWKPVMDWLGSRRGLLDGVVFSGGEPLMQRELPAAMREVRLSGFAVGLHTAGIYPDRLRAVLPEVDWIGFDLKAPYGKYARVTGAPGDEVARESLALVAASGKAYEVRCTFDPELLDAEDLVHMALWLQEAGVARLVLQPCRRNGRSCAIPDSLMAPALSFFPGLERRLA